MKYLVSPAPHKLARQNTFDMYIVVSFALIACLMMGYLYFDWQVLVIVATTLAPSVIFEVLFDLMATKKLHYPHMSSVVTGLILACIMPLNMPWYFGIGASLVAIASKYLFGGIGNNLFNPSALARAMLGVLSLGFSFDYFGDGNTALNLILSNRKGDLELARLFTGDMAGAVGTTCIVIILIAMVVLIVARVIRWENIAFAVLTYALMIWATMGYENILPMLLSGSFVFVAVFMLSDPTTSPYTFSGRCLYSIIFGILAAVMMKANVFGESAVFFALIVANLIAPMMDRLFSAFHRGVKAHD